MLIVKADTLPYLKKPLHTRWFGENKTWRGVIMMPLLTILGVYLTQLLEYSLAGESLFAKHPAWLTGLLLGLCYVLGELPNSFIKRRLAIPAGKLPATGRGRLFFLLFDQADVAVVCLPFLKFWLDVSWEVILWTLILGTLIHLVMNVLLFLLKVRKNPF